VSNTTYYGVEGLHDILASVVENRELFPEIGTAMPRSYGMLMHFAEGGQAGENGDTGLLGKNLTIWESSVTQYVKTLERRLEPLRKLCAKPFVKLGELMATAKKCVKTDTECGLTEGEIASLPHAVRFLHAAGAVLVHGDAGSKAGERVFMRPQWIVDAVKFVVREANAEDVDDELKKMDSRIHDEGYGNALKALKEAGHLDKQLLFTCLWGWPKHTAAAAKGQRKFPDDTHGALLDVLRDFGLLRPCGNYFLVPAMLPERPLLDGFDIGLWLPTEARAALRVMRRCFKMRALPGSFFSKLQLDWSVTEAKREQHFVQEYVATLPSRTASVLRRAKQQDGEAAVEEIVVVSMVRRKGSGCRRSEIRVMGWVKFTGDEVSESSVGSTSWSLFREVNSAIRKSARTCGIFDTLQEHIPILHPTTGEEIEEDWSPGGGQLGVDLPRPGQVEWVRIEALNLNVPRDNLIPPLEWWKGANELREMGRPGARRVKLKSQTPSNTVAAAPVATGAGAAAAPRDTGVVEAAEALPAMAEASAEATHAAGCVPALAGAASRAHEAAVDGGGHGGLVEDLREEGDDAAASGALGKRARSSASGGIEEQGGGGEKRGGGKRGGWQKWDDREEEALRLAVEECGGTYASGSWAKIHAHMQQGLGVAWMRTETQAKQHWGKRPRKEEKLSNSSQLSHRMDATHPTEVLGWIPAQDMSSNADAATVCP